jgi:protein involved in polysaccharide export with SLBB domain
VVLQGAVYRPGVFELNEGMTLTQLIKKADGLREDAFLSRGYIKRTNVDLSKEMISFDLRKVLSGPQTDISLVREDSIVIMSTRDLRDEQRVSIDGFVRSPGIFLHREGMKLGDLIALAGGFTSDAAIHRIEVSRIVRNQADTVANQLVKTITLQIDSNLNSTANDFRLQPLDYVYVPRLLNYHSLGNISVVGEVLFPGDYTIQKRDETIKEFIARAGGITPYGSLENAKILRNGIRVDADLTSKKNRNIFEVMAGDSIVIPRMNTLVEVIGAVNTPQLLSFTNRNFKHYINAAGGTKENISLRGAYIKYPNGINRPVGRFLFFRNYPAVKPGSTIVVPPRNTVRLKLGFGEISGITSALTALITLVAILSK